MEINFDDLVGPIQASLEGAAKRLYDGGVEVAEEDKEFFKDQAKVLAALAKDLSQADNDTDKATLVDAMEQQATTVDLRIATRRFELSQEATEQLKQVMKIASDVVISFLKKLIGI